MNIIYYATENKREIISILRHHKVFQALKNQTFMQRGFRLLDMWEHFVLGCGYIEFGYFIFVMDLCIFLNYWCDCVFQTKPIKWKHKTKKKKKPNWQGANWGKVNWFTFIQAQESAFSSPPNKAIHESGMQQVNA